MLEENASQIYRRCPDKGFYECTLGAVPQYLCNSYLQLLSKLNSVLLGTWAHFGHLALSCTYNKHI